MLAVCFMQDHREFNRQKSLPVLVIRNPSHSRSSASHTYSRFSINDIRARSGKKNDRKDHLATSGKRRSHSAKV